MIIVVAVDLEAAAALAEAEGWTAWVYAQRTGPVTTAQPGDTIYCVAGWTYRTLIADFVTALQAAKDRGVEIVDVRLPERIP